MFKFLRKYNKWILAVGGTLLMITFLIPQAIQGLSQQSARGGTTLATMVTDGKETKISRNDFDLAGREMLVLETLERFGAPNPARDQPVEFWYLLTHEAANAGLIGGVNLAYRSLPEPRDETLSRIAAQASVPREVVLQTLAKREGVSRMWQMYRGSGKFSDRRLMGDAARIFHGTTLDLVVLEAQDADDLPEPDDAAITAQYEKFREMPAGEGDQGFGYMFPSRAKVEWLTITRDSVREMIEGQWEASPSATRIELRKFWHLSQDDPAIPRVPENGGTGGIPDAVRTALLEQRTDETINEISRFITDAVRERRRGLPQKDGLVELPEDWGQRRLSFHELADLIREAHGIERPAYEAVGDRWLDAEALADLAALSSATTDKFGTRAVRFPELVIGAREFNPETGFPIQTDVTGPILTGVEGDLFVFRLTATDPARPPHDLAEVRDQVVTDLKRIEDFNRLRNSVDDIKSQAVNEGLLLLSLERDTSVQPSTVVRMADPRTFQFLLQLGVAPTISPTRLPVIGTNLAVTEQITDYALTLPQGPNVVRLPAEQRTLVIPVEESLAVLVAQITDQQPLTREEFEQYVSAGFVQDIVRTDELGNTPITEGPYSLDALIARYDFRRVVEDDVDPDAADTEGETTETASVAP